MNKENLFLFLLMWANVAPPPITTNYEIVSFLSSFLLNIFSKWMFFFRPCIIITYERRLGSIKRKWDCIFSSSLLPFHPVGLFVSIDSPEIRGKQECRHRPPKKRRCRESLRVIKFHSDNVRTSTLLPLMSLMVRQRGGVGHIISLIKLGTHASRVDIQSSFSHL